MQGRHDDYAGTNPDPLPHRPIGNVSMSSSKIDSSLGRFYPIFLRMRVVPDRHDVVTGEVDHDLIQGQESLSPSDKIGASDLGSLLKMARGKEEKRKKYGCVWMRWLDLQYPFLDSSKPLM